MTQQQNGKKERQETQDGPQFGMSMLVEKPRDFRGTIKKLLDYIQEYRLLMLVVLLFAIASTIFTIVGPKILGQAITKLFEGAIGQVTGTGPGIDFDFIGRIIVILLGLYILSALFSYVQGWVMANIAMQVTYRLRRDISEKISRMPLRYFDGTNHGEVLSRVTNDVETLSQTLNQSLAQIITSVTTMIGVLVMMLSISWVMTLAALLMMPVSFGIIMMVMGKSQKYFKAQQDYLGHVNGHVEEMYSGHVVVKAFNGERKSIDTFDGYNNTLYDSSWKAEFLSGLLFPVMGFVGNLGYVAIAILGGYFAVMGRITVGDIQAFIQYMRSFTEPVAQIANISNVLQRAAAAAERVFEFLEEEEEAPEDNSLLVPDTIVGKVRFEHVQFGYDPEKVIIRDFSAFVQPGQKIAIVGPTGAGKTTIVKLLMRFYDVQKGAIFIDDHPIQQFRRQDVRQMFGMVLQDAWLYSGSIMENIRYGRLNATDDEVIAAAQAAHVDHFVRTLPDGYQTELDEEVANISQGQKQLLTIARAILANPAMLILDEATSSVDTRTELLIQQAMAALMHNRTSFIIAHRLSTIRNADLILVMRDGDIVEQGTHQALLEQEGVYADLYNSQFDTADATP